MSTFEVTETLRMLSVIQGEIENVNSHTGWFNDPVRLSQENLLYSLWSLARNHLRTYVSKESVGYKDLLQDNYVILLLYRLSKSITILNNVATRTVETKKLINSADFLKSEYVLYVAGLFVMKGCQVEFRDEPNKGGPDLLLDGSIFIECKQRHVRSNPTIKDRFIDARKQLDKEAGPGIACLDYPGVHALDIDIISKEIPDELVLSSKINYCVITQTLRPELHGTKFRLPIRAAVFPHSDPSNLKSKCPTSFNIEDVFGKGTLVNVAETIISHTI